MNELFVFLGVAAWKPVLTALLLPPVPMIVLALVGARMILWRRGVGWLVLILAGAGLWLSNCIAVAEWLERAALAEPPPLSADRIAELKREAASKRSGVAIVVLGAGREPLAPEYGVSNLQLYSMARLRYGLWLARETGAPVAFSGGSGYAQQVGPAEAEVAARIAAQEFGRPLRWAEKESRDTRENAIRTVALLRGEHVQTLVLVTNGWHMPRAQRAFKEAIEREKLEIEVLPAPMGLARNADLPALRWMPSSDGLTLTRQVVREKFGWWLGA